MKLVALTATVLAVISSQAADKKAPAPRGKTAPAAAPAPAAPPEEYKSVFEEPRIDPFFPNSIRFSAPRNPTPGSENKPPPIPIEQLIVKGIFLGKEKTAIINGKTLAEGESATIKLPKASLQIHVIEIRQRSIVIKIDPDPDPKEIYLRATP